MLSAENGQLVSSLFVDGTVDAAGNNPGQGNLFNLAFPNVNPTPSVRLQATEILFCISVQCPLGSSTKRLLLAMPIHHNCLPTNSDCNAIIAWRM